MFLISKWKMKVEKEVQKSRYMKMIFYVIK